MQKASKARSEMAFLFLFYSDLETIAAKPTNSIETVYHLRHKPRAKGPRLEIQKGGFEMSKYAGTQTEKNLQAAFAGESQATNKYTYFASVAKKEGYEQIAEIFRKTSANEQYHAKCGSASSKASAPRRKTLPLQPMARTSSGLTCTTSSPRRLKKRVFPSSLKVPSGWRH